MARRSRAAVAAVGVAAVALAAGLAGCSGDDPPAGNSASQESPGSDAAPESSSPSSPDPEPSESASPPSGDPVAVEATRDLLDWRTLPGPVTTSITDSGPWRLLLPEDGSAARLEGPRPRTIAAPARQRITDALIDGEYAVVVSEDEQALRPNVATVVDLAHDRTFTVDGRSDVPTTTGGTWALGDGQLAHATIGPGHSYCLATVDLATGRGTRSWCAPRRHGFSNARITPYGTSLMSFDDQRPSCRTVAEVTGEELTAFAGPPDCTGWDGLLLEDASVWSVVPKQRRIEEAHFYAAAGGDRYDLGPGTSGSLTWCGGAAYFVRDPQRDRGPAALMRWDPTSSLTIAFATPAGGQAFLSEPRCGGDSIAVTALTTQGDRQVVAAVS